MYSETPYYRKIEGKKYHAYTSYDTKREAKHAAETQKENHYKRVRIIKTSDGYTLYVWGRK